MYLVLVPIPEVHAILVLVGVLNWIRDPKKRVIFKEGLFMGNSNAKIAGFGDVRYPR